MIEVAHIPEDNICRIESVSTEDMKVGITSTGRSRNSDQSYDERIILCETKGKITETVAATLPATLLGLWS